MSPTLAESIRERIVNLRGDATIFRDQDFQAFNDAGQQLQELGWPKEHEKH